MNAPPPSSGSTGERARTVPWKVHKTNTFDWTESGLQSWSSDAATLLSGNTPWKEYCDFLSKPREMNEIFALVLRYQQQAQATSDNTVASNVVFSPVEGHDFGLRTLTPRTGMASDLTEDEVELEPYTPGPDEQIVNTALISFLDARTLHSKIENGWSIHRLPLKANFEDASFEARTEGYLQDKGNGGTIRALVEVKAASRALKDATIRMQEVAQMVAWIKSRPESRRFLNKTGRRLHVSQDHDEIYITFAEYSAEYVFMTMHEYGPWDPSKRITWSK
ncbi:hypothetical protein BJX99DRAFT_244222 [Aspergillus californicus]